MSWQCKLYNIVGIEHVKYDPPLCGSMCGKTMLVGADGTLHDYDDLPIGAMFYVPADAEMHNWPWRDADKDHLSDYYFQNNSSRQPLLVKLPGIAGLFCVDGKCRDSEKWYGGWTVIGEAPNITVTPSINLIGIYHGWLQNGIISDDCEGRKFNS